MGNRNVNLVPFGELFLYGKMNSSQIILNVVIFVPLGIYAGTLFEKWVFGKQLFFFFLISFIVEALQFILAIGAFDMTDVFTNTLGGLMGLLIFKGLKHVFHNSVKAQKFINIIGVIGTIFMILFIVLLKIDMLPIRYK